jgi:hypothetical protein
MNNAQRQGCRADQYLRQTLVIDPETQWMLRRQSIGMTFTLPVDMESQAVLLEERRLAVEAAYKEIESP